MKKDLKRAKNIAEKYRQLEKCCSILSSLNQKVSDSYYNPYWGGWKMATYSIKDAGIDMKEIYNFIELLAKKKKKELALDLSKLGE